MNNYMKMEIKASLENVACVRVALTSFVSNLEITIDELMDVKTAVSEAVTNSIEHGYENNLDDNSTVIINAYIYEEDDDVIKIEVKDKGIGIEDVELALTPTYTSKPELEHAGMGFTIMETFMDEILIVSDIKKGTSVTMIKRIKKKKSTNKESSK